MCILDCLLVSVTIFYTNKAKIWMGVVTSLHWAMCKSAPCFRQITTPVPQHSVFYWLDALPAAKPTASKHWRHLFSRTNSQYEWQIVLLFLCLVHRSVELADPATVDDLMSECTAALMQEQAESLSDTLAGNIALIRRHCCSLYRL